MKNKLDTRISKIRSERFELLTLVSDSIKNNGKIVYADIKGIMDTIEYDEKCVKRYEAIVKAQNLITELATDITFATSEEEIIALRKKLNSCINKVKNELKKRNISEEDYNKYQESVKYLRSDISRYIRYVKRENNILAIEDMYSRYDTLTEEEQENLKKLVSKETRYNRRNLNPQPKSKKEVIAKIETSKAIEEPKVEIPKKEEQDFNEKVEDIIKEIREKEIIQKKEKSQNAVLRVVDSIEDVDNDDIKYLDIKIKAYDRQYDIQTPYSYDKPFLTRLKRMVKNIPLYKHNQEKIKNMQKDSFKYYGGSDLISYIAYLSKINSFKYGLKSVFNRSFLYSNENKLLCDHEKCAEWLLDYCKKNSLEINFLTRMKVVS